MSGELTVSTSSVADARIDDNDAKDGKSNNRAEDGLNDTIGTGNRAMLPSRGFGCVIGVSSLACLREALDPLRSLESPRHLHKAWRNLTTEMAQEATTWKQVCKWNALAVDAHA